MIKRLPSAEAIVRTFSRR